MMIHDVTKVVGKDKLRMRVGRGEGSGKGGTSGRGHNGAKSRAGWTSRPGYQVARLRSFEDFQSADSPIRISELITTSSMLRTLQSISKQEQLLMALLLPQLD